MKNDYLTVDEDLNKIYFDVDDLSILKSCGFVPNNCADDCFEGYSIAAFKCLD